MSSLRQISSDQIPHGTVDLPDQRHARRRRRSDGRREPRQRKVFQKETFWSCLAPMALYDGLDAKLFVCLSFAVLYEL